VLSDDLSNMQIANLLFSLAVTAGLIAGYIFCCKKVNRHAERRYGGFAPINGWTVSASALSCGALMLGVLLVQDPANLPPWPWSMDFFESREGNGVVLLGLGLAVALSLLAYLWHATSLLVGLASFLLLVIAGLSVVGVVVLIILLVLIVIDERQSRRPRRYY